MISFPKKHHVLRFGSGKARTIAFLASIVLTVGIFNSVSAQIDDELPEGVVPPPLAIVTDDDKKSLDAEKNAKNRTKLALEMMDARLEKSETLAKDEEFQKALDELGTFRALMNNTLAYLRQNELDKNILKNYKRFEMGLREFIPRIELVRRALPYSHSYHVTKLIIAVRETRRKAIEPFFEDTVIPNSY